MGQVLTTSIFLTVSCNPQKRSKKIKKAFWLLHWSLSVRFWPSILTVLWQFSSHIQDAKAPCSRQDLVLVWSKAATTEVCWSCSGGSL